MPIFLQPMNTGEVLDRTFVLYRKYFLLFVGISAAPHLIQLAFQILSGIMTSTPAREMPSLAILAGRLASQLASFLVMLVVLAISQAATAVAVSSVHMGQPAGIADSYRRLAGKIARIVAMIVLAGFGVSFGLLLMIVPGILVALAWSLCVPAAVIENLGIGGALSRSSDLSKGSRGRIFLVYVLFTVLNFGFILLWEVPLLLIADFPSLVRQATVPVWFVVGLSVGQFITESLIGPLLTIAIVLIYYDQRVRMEAFDLQYMIAAVNRAQPDAPAQPNP